MIASITGAVIAMNGMIPAISKSSHSLQSANEAAVRRIGTDVEILGIASDSSEPEIEAWVKNVGIYSIGPVAAVGPGSWRESPLGASWYRGEVLNLQMVIPQGFPVSERYHILRLATPNGVIGEDAFERW